MGSRMTKDMRRLRHLEVNMQQGGKWPPLKSREPVKRSYMF